MAFGIQRTSDRLWAVSDVWLRSDSSSCVLSDDPTRGTHKGRCLVIARRPCKDQGHRHGTSGHGTQQSTADMVLPPPELGPPGRIQYTCRQPDPPPALFTSYHVWRRRLWSDLQVGPHGQSRLKIHPGRRNQTKFHPPSDTGSRSAAGSQRHHPLAFTVRGACLSSWGGLC